MVSYTVWVSVATVVIWVEPKTRVRVLDTRTVVGTTMVSVATVVASVMPTTLVAVAETTALWETTMVCTEAGPVSVTVAVEVKTPLVGIVTVSVVVEAPG